MKIAYMRGRSSKTFAYNEFWCIFANRIFANSQIKSSHITRSACITFNFFRILITRKTSNIILCNISLRIKLLWWRRAYLWCCFPLTRDQEYPVVETRDQECPIAMMTNQIWELNIPSTNQRDLRNGPISEEQRLTGIKRAVVLNHEKF